jgi:excisionase family DNA binding protein
MGTRGTWAHTERTETFLGAGLPSGEGTRTRTREFVVHADTIKRLPTGYATVTSTGPRGTPHRANEPPRGRPMTHPSHTHDVPRLDTPLLTPAEAAQLLAVRSSWIYEAVRAGTLPCLRIGRHIRFTRTMLEEWLQGRGA